jgi:hypothetical protein
VGVVAGLAAEERVHKGAGLARRERLEPHPVGRAPGPPAGTRVEQLRARQAPLAGGLRQPTGHASTAVMTVMQVADPERIHQAGAGRPTSRVPRRSRGGRRVAG